MLTPKQEAFCIAYMETGNASEAYRRSYDVSESTKEATINRAAKELIDNPKIAARLDELRAPVVQKAAITLESHLEELANLRDMARDEGKYAAAVAAEVARGKASGVAVTRTEVTGKDGEPIAVMSVPVDVYLKARAKALQEF